MAGRVTLNTSNRKRDVIDELLSGKARSITQERKPAVQTPASTVQTVGSRPAPASVSSSEPEKKKDSLLTVSATKPVSTVKEQPWNSKRDELIRDARAIQQTGYRDPITNRKGFISDYNTLQKSGLYGGNDLKLKSKTQLENDKILTGVRLKTAQNLEDEYKNRTEEEKQAQREDLLAADKYQGALGKLAESGLPVMKNRGENQFYYAAQTADERNAPDEVWKTRPEDYWDGTKREEYDMIMYDSIYGDGAYDRIVFGDDTTDEDIDALENELNDLWDSLENGKIQNKYEEAMDEFSAKMNQDRGDYGSASYQRMMDRLDAETKNREEIEQYEANAPEGNWAYDPDAIKTNDVRNARIGRHAGKAASRTYQTTVVNGDRLDQIYYKANNPVIDRDISMSGKYYNLDAAQFMSPKQVETFNAYFLSGDRESAQAYYDALEPYLQSMKMYSKDVYETEMSQNEYAPWMIGKRILTQPAAGIMGTAGAVAAAFGNEDAQDPDNELFYGMTRSNQNIQNARAQVWGKQFQDWFGDTDLANNVGQWFNGIVYSMADNLVARGIGMGVGGAIGAGEVSNLAGNMIQLIMSSEATASQMYTNMKDGMDPSEAVIRAFGSGAIEWITEKYSTDRFFENFGNGNIAKQVVANFFPEAQEEGTGKVMETLLDEILSPIYGHESEFRQKVQEYDKEYGEGNGFGRALLEYCGELGSEMLAGGVSGGVMGGVGGVHANILNHNADVKLGKTAVQSGTVDVKSAEDTRENMATEATNEFKLLEAAEKLDPGSEARTLAKEIREGFSKGSKINYAKFGQMVRAIMNESNEQIGNIAQTELGDVLKTQLINAGEKEADAIELSQVLMQGIVNQALSPEMLLAIHDNKNAMALWHEYRVSDAAQAVQEKIKPLQEAQKSVMDLMIEPKESGITPESVSGMMAGAQAATAEDIAEADANGKRSGSALEVIADGMYGEIKGFTTKNVKGEDGKNHTVVMAQIGEGDAAREVDISQVKGLSDGAAQVLQVIGADRGQVIKNETAKALFNLVQSTKDTAGTVADAMKTMWAAAMQQKAPKTNLDKTAQDTITEAIQKDMDAAEEQRVQNWRKITPGQGRAVYNGFTYGTKQFNDAISKLGNTARNEANVIGNYAKSMGVEVELYYDAEDSARQGAFYGGQDGAGIRINLAGTINQQGAHRSAVATFAHEVTHNIEANSPTAYKELRTFVLQNVQKNGKNLQGELQHIMDNYEAHGESIDLNGAIAELVAMGSEQVLTSEEVAAQLKQQDPSLFGKVRKAVTRLINQIRGIKGDVLTTSSRYARAIQNVGDRMAKIWLAAYEEAKNAEAPAVLRSGNEEYSFMGTDETTGASVYLSNYAENTAKQIKQKDFVENIQNIFSKKPILLTLEGYDERGTRNIQAQFDPAFDQANRMKTDAGKLAYNKKVTSNPENRVRLNLAGDLQQIIGESVNYDSKADKNSNPDVRQWHYFNDDIYYVAQDSDTMEPYKIDIAIREKSNGSFVYTYEAVKDNSRQEKKLSLMEKFTSVNAGRDSGESATASNESIAQAKNQRKGQSSFNDENTIRDENGDVLAEVLPGGTITKYSWASWQDEDIEALTRQLIARGFDKKDVTKWIKDVNGVAAMIAANRDVLDYEASPYFTMLKNNQEYVKTLDASTLCAKRLLYQGIFNEIQHLLPNTPILPDDLIKLVNMMKKRGLVTPCGICYVESRRRMLGKYAQQWLESYDGAYNQVTTTDGLEALRESHPQTYQDFVDAMNAKGSANPKVVQLRTDYRGEIKKLTDSQVTKVKEIGGLRVQSFSDFEIVHMIDMMQAVMDMAAMDLTSQAYTKVPEFAWVFGDTGIKINLSLIGEGNGLDENGNLIFSSTEGMDFDEAMALRKRYSKNVGTILVGMNDAHVIAAMGDSRIDFIIPFHKSGWSKKEMARVTGMSAYKDYTRWQNEKKLGDYSLGGYKTIPNKKSKIKNLEPVGPNGYWDFNKTGTQNAEEYLRICKEDGRVPKFANFLVYNGDGSFSLPQGDDQRSRNIRDGYWKLLIDFKMYDNSGVGSPQTTVQPKFNMQKARDILNNYDGSVKELPTDHELAKEFAEEYKAEHPGRKVFSMQDDAEYMDALNSGDMESAQRMVDEAANAAGYTIRAYHGSNAEFTEFKGGNRGEMWFASTPETAYERKKTYDTYLKMNNPYEVTYYIGAESKFDPTFVTEEGRHNGHDGGIVHFKLNPEYVNMNIPILSNFAKTLPATDPFGDNFTFMPHGKDRANLAKPGELMIDFMKRGAEETLYDWYVVYNPNQIKSAEPVTYDDDGNVIPPSERFNTKKPDIRWSMQDDTDYDVKAWMETVPEWSLRTEAEKALLRSYGSLRRKGQMDQLRMEKVDREIKRLEGMLKNQETAEGTPVKTVTVNEALKDAGVRKYGASLRLKSTGETIGALKLGVLGIYEKYKDILKQLTESGAFEYDEKLGTWTAKAQNIHADEEREIKTQLAALQIKKQNLQTVMDQTNEKLAEITGDEGFGNMMYRQQKVLNDLVYNKTQEEVRDSIEKMESSAKRVQGIIDENRKKADELESSDVVKRFRELLGTTTADQTAAELKKEFSSTWTKKQIREYLDPIILKMKSGEDFSGDVETLAGILVNSDSRNTYDELEALRGLTITIGKGAQAELKAQNSSLKEIRARLAGTGITVKYGDRSTLEADIEDLRAEYPMIPELGDEKDALQNFVSWVEGMKNQSAGNEFYDQRLAEAMAMITGKAAGAAKGIYMPNDPKAQRQVLAMMDFVKGMNAETQQAQEALQQVADEMGAMQKAGREASGKTDVLMRDVNVALDYYNRISKIAVDEAKQKRTSALIEQLKSEQAQKIIKNNEEWRALIQRDADARKQLDENRKAAAQINTSLRRMYNLLKNPKGLKNIPEHMQGLVREVLSIFADNDMSGGRRFLNATRQGLEEMQRLLSAWEKQDGKFNLSDLTAMDPDNFSLIVIANDLDTINEGITKINTPINGKNKLDTLQQRGEILKEIQEAVSEIYSAVRAEQQVQMGDRRVAVEDAAYEIFQGTNGQRFKELTGSAGAKMRALHRLFVTNNLTPEYYFRMLDNKGLTDLWENYHKAENRNGLELEKAQKRLEEISNKYGYNQWNPKQKFTIKFSGQNVEITLGQLMSLYATWKREHTLGPQMSEHLTKGGFYAEQDLNEGILGKKEIEKKAHRVTEDDMKAVEDTLTENQKAFVDDVVRFMSNDMSALGNEASMAAYGIRMYKEKYYFPFQMWEGVKNRKSNDAGGAAAAQDRAFHPSFANNRMHGASNALIIGDFMQTAADHIAGMINYATMGLANENFQKAMNYQMQEGDVSAFATKRNAWAAIAEAYGMEAEQYLKELQKQLNGGAVKVDKTFYDNLISLFRKNAVAGSLSVALQQPLSYIRAAMLIDSKYLARALSPDMWKGSYEEMMAHSGVAVIKDMGRFDMNFGQSAREYLMPDAKQSAGRKVWEGVKEYSTILPELMDRMTWTRMWSAVKAEQKAQHPEMDVNSDEFLDMCGVRFNNIMRRTQVYDSVLVKSANMRSTSPAIKMMTSFMAEPTLTLNVLADSLQQAVSGKKGGKILAAKAGMLTLLSAVLQAAVKGLMGSGRTPDEKKTWWENFLYRFEYNFLNEADPLQLVPGASDVITLLKGGELKDDAYGALQKMITAGDNMINMLLGNNDLSWRNFEDSAAQLVQMFSGVPMKNLMRDGRAMWNWAIEQPYAKRESSGSVIKGQAEDLFYNADNLIGTINKWLGDAGFNTENKAYYQRIYAAKKAGDEKAAQDMIDYLLNGKGVKQETIGKNMATLAKADDSMTAEETAEFLMGEGKDPTDYIKSQLKEGKMNAEDARKMLQEADPERSADSVWWTVDRIQYQLETGAKEAPDGNYYRLKAAINEGKNDGIKAAVKDLLDHGFDRDKIKKWIPRKDTGFKAAYLEAKGNEKIRIKNALIMAYKAIGISETDANEIINKWK